MPAAGDHPGAIPQNIKGCILNACEMREYKSACLAQVTIPGEDTPRERAFAIRIKWAATVDIKAVVDFVRCGCALGAGTDREQATRVVRVLRAGHRA